MSRRRMLMAGYYPPIPVDISNTSYTVPYGYTRCNYTLYAIARDMGGTAEPRSVSIYKNSIIIDSHTDSAAGSFADGSFGVVGDDVVSSSIEEIGYGSASIVLVRE